MSENDCGVRNAVCPRPPEGGDDDESYPPS